MSGTTAIQDVALGFSYKNVLAHDGPITLKELVFQSHVGVDTPLAEINLILDKVRLASDRQAAVYELVEAKRALEVHLQKIDEIEKQLALQEETYKATWEASGRKGDWSPDQLPAKERQAKMSVLQSLQRWRDGAIKADTDIKRLSILVNGHASHSGADRHAGEPGS